MQDDALDLGDPMPRIPVDYDALAEELSALAYPARLELLALLRAPHLASEIRLVPRRVGPGENADRPAAKPTVQAHLDKLVQGQFVHVSDVGAGGRKAFRYSVNAHKLYGLVEDLRRLGLIYAGRGVDPDPTGTVTQDTVAAATTGPRLIIVHGVYEGKAFPLTAKQGHERRWTIGRKRDASISLDYDGYVSAENCEVVPDGDGFVLRDLGSKNGTYVNWRALRRGAMHRLRAADVVGVGRSLLVYADS